MRVSKEVVPFSASASVVSWWMAEVGLSYHTNSESVAILFVCCAVSTAGGLFGLLFCCGGGGGGILLVSSVCYHVGRLAAKHEARPFVWSIVDHVSRASMNS